MSEAQDSRGDSTSASEDARIAAKVEELDRLIADLQRRKTELLMAKKSAYAAPPVTMETKVPPKVERPNKPAARASAPIRQKSALEGTLDALPWKSFKKKEGEWAFLRTREGMLIDELQSETAFVDEVRKKGELVVGKYRYQVSEDKFLNRYFAGA
jgi:hypothetical protein